MNLMLVSAALALVGSGSDLLGELLFAASGFAAVLAALRGRRVMPPFVLLGVVLVAYGAAATASGQLDPGQGSLALTSDLRVLSVLPLVTGLAFGDWRRIDCRVVARGLQTAAIVGFLIRYVAPSHAPSHHVVGLLAAVALLEARVEGHGRQWLMLAIVVVASGSRGALVGSMLVEAASAARRMSGGRRGPILGPAKTGALLLLAAGALAAIGLGYIPARIAEAGRVVASIATDSLEDDHSVTARNVDTRLEVWSHAAEEVSRRPWVGVGAGRADDVLAGSSSPIHREFSTHNFILHVVLELGLVGGMLVAAVGAAIWSGLRKRTSSEQQRDLIWRVSLLLIAYGFTSNGLATLSGMVCWLLGVSISMRLSRETAVPEVRKRRAVAHAASWYAE